jgi:hypothetical protein
MVIEYAREFDCMRGAMANWFHARAASAAVRRA